MKKGLEFLSTLLSISIIFLAVTLLAFAVLFFMQESNIPENASIYIDSSGGYTAYDPSKKIACIQVSRGADDANLSELQVIFLINGNSVEYRVPPPESNESLPELNNQNTYCFNLSKYGVPEKVAIAPIYFNGKFGIKIDSHLDQNTLTTIPSALYGLPSGGGGGSNGGENGKNDDGGNFAVERTKTYAYAWLTPLKEYDNIVSFEYSRAGYTKKLSPASVKILTDKMPEGHRVISHWGLTSWPMCPSTFGTRTANQDYCTDESGRIIFHYCCFWLDHGMADAQRAADAWWGNYSRLGGKADYIALDEEVFPTNPDNITGNPGMDYYSAILIDPRSKPIRDELGITNISHLSFAQYEGLGKYYKETYELYIHNATYNIIKKYYPDIKLSDFGGRNIGTHIAPIVYNDRYYKTKFMIFKKGISDARNERFSSDQNRSMSLWLADQNSYYLNESDLFYDQVFHNLLLNVSEILWWNAWNWDHLDIRNQVIGSYQDKFSKMLHQFDEIAGYTDKRSLIMPDPDFEKKDFVLSGMYAGGRNVWRFTPDLSEGQTISSVLKSNSGEVVLQTQRYIIRFPQGEIYTSSENIIDPGYWIIQSKDAVPQISKITCLAPNDIDLLLSWTFDNVSENNKIIFDDAGKNNGAVFGSPVRVDGKKGLAMNFNGANSYIQSSKILLNSSVTFSFWAKTDQIKNGNLIMGTEPGGSFNTFGNGWEFRFRHNPASKIEVARHNVSLNPPARLSSQVAYPNLWNSYIVSYDRGTGKAVLYVNGEEATNDDVIYYGDFNPTVFDVGRTSDGYYNGTIDEVKIFGRAISYCEANGLYNSYL